MAVVHRASVRMCGGSFADNGPCIWEALLHISTIGLLYIWLLYIGLLFGYGGGSFVDNDPYVWVALVHISPVGLLYIWLLYTGFLCGYVRTDNHTDRQTDR